VPLPEHGKVRALLEAVAAPEQARVALRVRNARPLNAETAVGRLAYCDALLRSFGLPLSKLANLHVEWDGRVVNKAESFFSKTKAAPRCAAAPRAQQPLLGTRAE
jgi:hypothetical protein